jgi:hypothetical protein
MYQELLSDWSKVNQSELVLKTKRLFKNWIWNTKEIHKLQTVEYLRTNNKMVL